MLPIISLLDFFNHWRAGFVKYAITTCKDHTPDQPNLYLAWHEWANRMSKTHRQVKCRECGLYKIWVPKQKRITKN